jgi:hypothetical protein
MLLRPLIACEFRSKGAVLTDEPEHEVFGTYHHTIGANKLFRTILNNGEDRHNVFIPIFCEHIFLQ